MNTLISIGLIALWVCIATWADMCFKSASNLFSREFAMSLSSYIATAPLAFATFRYASWGYIFIVWSAGALLLSMAIGLLVYDEPMTTRRMIAAALVLGAIPLAE